MANISATDQTWLIYEIIEAIFLELPLRDLLVNAQRVSRAWNTVINLPSFQKRLFFEPRPKNHISEAKLNPLLLESFPAFFTRAAADNIGVAKWHQEILSEADWNSSPEKIDAYSRKEASWRQMLVSQPPITIIKVIKTTSTPGLDGKREGRLVKCRGLKMGTLYDFIDEEVHSGSTHDSTGFDLEWNNIFSLTNTSQHEMPTKYIPPHVRTRSLKRGLTVHISSAFSCCAEMREDYQVPEHLKGKDFKDMTREERGQIMKAQMSNARPQLRSKAYKHVHITWGSDQFTRGN